MEVLCRNTLLREDFIKIKNNLTLPEALINIQEKKLTVDRYPVTLYRSVIGDQQIKSFDALSEMKTCNSFEVFEQKFESIADGVHKIIWNSKKFDQIEEPLKLSFELNMDLESNTSQLYGLQAFTEYFLQIINSEFPALHFESDLFGIDRERYLKFSKSTLLNVEPISGVNIPTWTILSPGSVLPFNNYNRNLAEVNILLQGKSRIYVIIPFPFVKYFMEKLHLLMQTSCKFQLLHRPGCMVIPRLLLKWNIPIQFFIQKPGDLIFINKGVLFCAINDGLSLVESINFLYKTRILDLSQISCQCENRNLSIIKDSLLESKKIFERKSKKEIYKCKQKNCIGGMAIYNKKTFYAHCVEEHGLKPFPCLNENCTKRFTRKHDATRHLESYHKKTMHRKLSNEYLIKRKETIVCHICDKSISRRNLRRHMTQKHHLKSYLLEHSMKKHLRQYYTSVRPLTAEVYLTYEEFKDQRVTSSQIVELKQLACNKTELESSKTKYNFLKKNLLVEMKKLREEQKKIEQDKIHDTFILKLELQKAKRANNQLKNDQDKKIVQIEKLQEELQRQKNTKYCKMLHLQLKLENTERKLNEITVERDDTHTLLAKLQNNLVAARAEIEQIQLETMSNQVQFCKSLLLSKSSNENTVNSKPHKYCLRNHLYK